MVIVASGINSWARAHDGGGDDGVAQYGGHTPNNRLIETRSLNWFT